MIVECLKHAQGALPYLYNGMRVYMAPTTFLARDEEFELDGKGGTFRVLTPQGGGVLADIDTARKRWPAVAIQQLASDIDGFYVSGPNGIVWYGDYFEQMSTAGDEEVDQVVSAVHRHLEGHFGEQLVHKGFRRKDKVFVVEVGPSFIYEKTAVFTTLQRYWAAVKAGTITIEGVLRRLVSYGHFLGEPSFPRELVKTALDWLVKETGRGSFPGVVDESSTDGKALGQGFQPCARLYYLHELDAIPRTEPVAFQAAFVLPGEVLVTPRLDTVWTALKDKIAKWSGVVRLVSYLEGVSTQEEFEYLSRKLKAPPGMDIGVCVCSWGQLLRIDKSRGISSSYGVLLNIDSLVDDGLLYSLHTDLGIDSEAPELLYDVLARRSLGRDISMLYTDLASLSILTRLCQYVDQVYTLNSGLDLAIMALAASKV